MDDWILLFVEKVKIKFQKKKYLIRLLFEVVVAKLNFNFSGVDIPALLQTLSVSETVINKLQNSTMGHLAIAYMCYKIMTPVRYTVTVGKLFFFFRFFN